MQIQDRARGEPVPDAGTPSEVAGELTGTPVVVVGAGVSGLSCAARLLEAGHPVEVWSRTGPEDTTSRVAAALWYPYRVGPVERTGAWALASYAVFEALARRPDTGVVMVPGVELFHGEVEAPGWRAGLAGCIPAAAGELPEGYAGGYRVEVPVVEMPIYLPWLTERVRALGGRLVQREVGALEEALEAAPLVVNCAGLGARELVPDPELFAIRGQIVRVEGAAVEGFVLDEHHPGGVTYVVPRSGDCVLGGTAEEGVESLEPDPEQTRAILERCRARVPGLAQARPIGTSVGLRPGRREVRLELESFEGPSGSAGTAGPGAARTERVVAHDYGHGGAGVTLSWGCADEVRALLEAWERARPRG